MTASKKKILYIDDEAINLRQFRNTFRREYEIITAKSASEGLKILKNSPIDLVITDQRMPETTGVELLSKIQERFPNIPPSRMIISGYSDYDDIELAYKNYQLFKFISKPWDPHELLEVIKKAMNDET
ncbi:MAG: response regulator [Prolixibacteraceae bacterium]|nr:response regulator [Prolixibacteraceae bacterium]